MVKINVARKKVVLAIQTQRAGSTSSSKTKKIAATCAKVLALPKMVGRKSRRPAIMNNTPLISKMEISRLNTTTVYFQGITCSMESTRNSVLISSLSAMGSRYWPSTVCWCRVRARRPHPAPANRARPVSRPHRRQAADEHAVSRALHRTGDSLEIYRRGVQPRYLHLADQRRVVHDRRPARFSPHHLRQSQHLCASGRDFLCLAAAGRACTLGLDCEHNFLARYVYLHHCLRRALCIPGATPSACARAAPCHSTRTRPVQILILYSG